MGSRRARSVVARLNFPAHGLAVVDLNLGSECWAVRKRFDKTFGPFSVTGALVGLTEVSLAGLNHLLVSIPDPKAPGIAAHEAFHCAHRIMKFIDCALTDDTEEVYAYLIQAIVAAIEDHGRSVL